LTTNKAVAIRQLADQQKGLLDSVREIHKLKMHKGLTVRRQYTVALNIYYGPTFSFFY